MAIVFTILILSLLVIAHELGHFVMARKAKVKVEEFGLGYPPLVMKLFKWKETWFTLNAIPFGGFVKLEGEDEVIAEKEELAKAKKSKYKPFYAVTPYQKIAILLGGVVVNFVIGIFLFFIIYFFSGIPTDTGQLRILEVFSNSPAAQANVQLNTQLLGFRVNDTFFATDDALEVQEVVGQNKGSTITLVTSGQCDGLSCPEILNEYEVYVRTDDELPAGEGSIGIVFDSVALVKYPWYEMPVRAFFTGLEQSIQMGRLIMNALGTVFAQLLGQGKVPQDIAGPIGIVHQAQTQELYSHDWQRPISFAAMISINLAILNVLPIPALDGGRVLFVALGTLFSKKKVSQIEAYVNYAGYLLLLALIVMITYRDIVRIAGW